MTLPVVADIRRRFAAIVGRGALDDDDAVKGTLRFIAMGLVSTAAYFVLVLALNAAGLPARLASVAAMVLCWGISYVAQSRVTFRMQATSRADVARFIVMSLAALAIADLSMLVLYGQMGLPLWIAAGAVCVAIPVFNFAVMNFWVFRRPSRVARPDATAQGSDMNDR